MFLHQRAQGGSKWGTRDWGHEAYQSLQPSDIQTQPDIPAKSKREGVGEGGGDLDRLFPDFLHGLAYELLVLVLFVKPAEEVRGFLLHVQRPLLASLPQEGGKRERE